MYLPRWMHFGLIIPRLPEWNTMLIFCTGRIIFYINMWPLLCRNCWSIFGRRDWSGFSGFFLMKRSCLRIIRQTNRWWMPWKPADIWLLSVRIRQVMISGSQKKWNFFWKPINLQMYSQFWLYKIRNSRKSRSHQKRQKHQMCLEHQKWQE